MRALFCELPVGVIFIARYVVCFLALYDILFMRYPIFDYLYNAQNPSYPIDTFWGKLMMPVMDGGGLISILSLLCMIALVLFALGIAHFTSGIIAWLSYLIIAQTGFDLTYGAHAFTFIVFPALIALRLPDKKKTEDWWLTPIYSPAILMLQIILAWFYFESGLSKVIAGDFNTFILTSFAAKNTFLTEWLRNDIGLGNIIFAYFPYLEMLAGVLMIMPSRWRILGTACAAMVQIGIFLTVQVGYFPLLNLGLLLLTLTPPTLPRIEWRDASSAPTKASWLFVALALVAVFDIAERYGRYEDASQPVAPFLSSLGIYPSASFFTNFTWHPEYEIIGTDENGSHYLLSASADDSMSFRELFLLGIPLNDANTEEPNAPKLLWYLNYFHDKKYKHQVSDLSRITALSVEPGEVRQELFSAQVNTNATAQ